MTRIAHISDTHFGTEEPLVCVALRAALLRASPDLVVFTGDITQRARAAQFRAARAFVDSLAPLPVLIVPGNHDIPLFDLLTRLVAPYRNFHRHIGPDLAPLWQNSQMAVLGFNSTHRLRHKNGVISPAAVAFVAARLTALPQPCKIVALHHPLASATAEDIANCARGNEAAIAAWSAAGADLFLGGHIHLAYCLATGAAPHRVLAANTGTATSRRRRGGMANSFNLVELAIGSKPGLQITRLDYQAARGEFAVAHEWTGLKGPQGWAVAEGGQGLPPTDKTS
ncbi:MAG: DNA repair exonuclease [Betaproteobacteria bacterium HGW-Betaproteobacteria-7]|jgi:3',5'-cyclic AMP phosphodiesterase CpdA|nr:MAG: DNA repair exonuclease [Betaproteobacteria bacterium HGW-Betaproteobacteria-7]